MARTLLYLAATFATVAVAEVQLQWVGEGRSITIPPERLARVEQLTGHQGRTVVPIEVISETEAARRGVPSWVAGYAAREGLVVIPGRAVTYPNDGLEDLVLHELAHALIGEGVPRWFHEGVAMFAATGWGFDDQTRLTMAMISSGVTPLRQLDGLFRSDYASVSQAYAVAGAFVRHLVRQHGPEVIAGILDRIRAGEDFETAFRAATGQTLEGAEASFWRGRTIWSRWVPLVTSSLVLWIGVTALALGAIAARRRRNAARLRQWQEEEEVEDVS